TAYDADPTQAGASAASATPLGSATAAADGSFRLDLAQIDRARLFLLATDRAGNRSPVVNVKDVVWTATLAGKVPGSEFENPHDYELRPRFERRHQQPESQVAVADAQSLVALDGQAMAAAETGRAGSWLSRSWSKSFSRRDGLALAYDEARRRVLLFGGGDGNADTWEWDGSSWSERTPKDPEKDGNPSPRKGHAMAYDAARGRVVLFGGEYKGSVLQDLWEWDGASWALRTLEGPAPSARARHALAYDRERERVLLFGGEVPDGSWDKTFLDDLWEWDGARWHLLGAGGGPPARSEHGMVFDPERKRLLLFGGRVKDSVGDNTVHQDTWEWDGAAWSKILVETKPEARRGHAMVFVPRVGVVVFGGSSGNRFFHDSWVFAGATWSAKASATSPLERAQAGMAFDASRNWLVLCGGLSAQNLDDTWEWDGTSWEAQGTAATPPPRRWHSLAYDPRRGRTVLFGGESRDGEKAVFLNDTWEWNGMRWHKLTPAAGEPCPSPRRAAALAYDAARGQMVLFGGTDDARLWADTWQWDGERWKVRTPPAPQVSPSPRFGHVMVFDPYLQEVLLNGGSDHAGYTALADSWLFNGESWRQARAAGAPQARCFHALAYDQARRRAVLFGGQTFRALSSEPFGRPSADGETYEWDSQGWVLRVPEGSVGPLPLTGHAMAYGARGDVLLFGGGTWLFGSSPVAATWSWDGQRWSQVEASGDGDGVPSARSGHGLVFDDARHRAVLFGGWDAAGNLLSDTWEWENGASARPGQVARFAFAAAEAERGTVLRAVTATWWAGGNGENASLPIDGVRAYVWDRGTFMPVAAASFGLSTPGMLRWTTTDPEQTARLITGPRKEITLAIAPQGTNGSASARVEVDYVELKVAYRLP
ncbi:MAG: hypothetical protein HY901_07710, partial [Deltaproteobacteria bacterium]|nr:hypothetical protein [Deltaproteobacteria bacterium]